MADTQRILHHIAELYAKPRVNQDLDSAILEMEEKMSARFDDYDLAFSEKLTVDVLKAVDDFWRFKSDKTRPTLAQILAMENADTTKKERKDFDPESLQGMRIRIFKCADDIGDKFGKKAREKYLSLAAQYWPDVDLSGHEWTQPVLLGCERKTIGDVASVLMKRDIALGCCRHLLPVYEKSVRYVVEELLSREIPVSEWRQMDFSEKVSSAMKKGLFNGFSDILILICRKYHGSDFQFDSEKQAARSKTAYLPVHYTDNDFELSEGF